MITTKQELLETLQKYFNTDKITDELLFDGSQLTKTGVYLTLQYRADMLNTKGETIYYKDLSGWGQDWALPYDYRTFSGWEKYNEYIQQVFNENLLPNTIKPKLDKFVGENGCWFAHTDMYRERSIYVILICPNNIVLDMLENETEQYNYIVD